MQRSNDLLKVAYRKAGECTLFDKEAQSVLKCFISEAKKQEKH